MSDSAGCSGCQGPCGGDAVPVWQGKRLHGALVGSGVVSSLVWVKAGPTLLRSALVGEVGRILATRVADAEGLRVESVRTVGSDSVVARNPGPIGIAADGEEIFNEWVIDRVRARELYGDAAVGSLGPEFRPFAKLVPVSAAELSREALDELGVQGEWVRLVRRDGGEMLAREGDWVTEEGHSISRRDMAAYLEEVARSPVGAARA